MSTMTISLPETMKDWVESLTIAGEYSSSSDYVRDLIRRDKEKRAKLSLSDLQDIVKEARQSGISEKTVADIFADAVQIHKMRNGV